MKHVLCITNGLSGMAHASFELARRLVADGQRVTYACPRDLGERARAEGIDYRQLPPMPLDPAPQLEPTGRGPIARLRHKAREWATRHDRRSAGVRALGMDAFRAMLQDTAPDLCLLDSELHEHIMTATVEGAPTALLSPWFCTRRRDGLPPIQSGTVPLDGVVGPKPAIAAEWRAFEKGRRRARRRTRRRYFGTDRRGVLLAYAREIGFPKDRICEDDGLPMFSYRDLPTLSMTAQEMELPHDPHPDLYYVGPMVAERRAENSEVSDRVAADCRAATAAGRPIVYCSVSTMPPLDASFVRRLVDAFRDRPDLVLVLGLGGARVEDLRTTGVDGPLPDNVHAYPWVPQLAVLQHAACAIHHAGIHSIHECIRHDVPMLIFPGRRFDQPGCAARLEHHGLATIARGPRPIQDAIDATIADRAMRSRVAAMRARFDRYASERVLEATVEGLSSPTPPS